MHTARKQTCVYIRPPLATNIAAHHTFWHIRVSWRHHALSHRCVDDHGKRLQLDAYGRVGWVADDNRLGAQGGGESDGDAWGNS